MRFHKLVSIAAVLQLLDLQASQTSSAPNRRSTDCCKVFRFPTRSSAPRLAFPSIFAFATSITFQQAQEGNCEYRFDPSIPARLPQKS